MPDKPSAVLFFQTELALSALPELGERTAARVRALVPGGVTLLLPNPAHRFPLACGPNPDVLGLRVPALPVAAAALHEVRWPVLQSSANRSGGPDARRIDDVDARPAGRRGPGARRGRAPGHTVHGHRPDPLRGGGRLDDRARRRG